MISCVSRFFTIVFRLVFHLVSVVRVLRKRESLGSEIAAESATLCENLGGAFPKAGQILSTRADLISAEVRSSLCRLQDNVAPLPEKTVLAILARTGIIDKLRSICATAGASATVAQVHQATRLDDGRLVALKILRPGVQQEMVADCGIIRLLSRVLAIVPKMSSIPVYEALSEVTELLVSQTDFRREARNHLRLHNLFADSDSVIVPNLHEDLCTDTVLAMDFIPDMKKISDPTLSDRLARRALTIGVRALYKMIFEEGFIHCDMHPGNVFVATDGRLVILDAGFMIELSDQTRRAFARFFLAIAFRDGDSASRTIRETALRLPSKLDVEIFDREISDLIDRVGGLTARDFQVAGFVGELFAIMRKHNIYGASQFTLIILSLLVYEGLAKQRHPDLNFQQEAISFVITALARRTGN